MIVNKIEMSNPKISLINYIDTPPNPNSTNMLEIVESGASIHLSRQSTPTMAPVMIDNDIKSRLPDESTMESTHIATLQLQDLLKQERHIHILPKIQTAPLISFGILCDDGCTITLDKKEISTQQNGKEIINGTRNKKTGIWEVHLGPQQPEHLVNNILAQTLKPEISQYLHAALLSPTTSSILKAIKQGFLRTWPGLIDKLIKKHLEK